MKKLIIILGGMLVLNACSAQRQVQIADRSDVERIVRTLSADDMQGRGVFTPGIEKAAKFIEKEFSQIGLQPLSNESSFRQPFTMTVVKPGDQQVVIDNNPVPAENILVLSDRPEIKLTPANSTAVFIKGGQSFFENYRRILETEDNVLVLVDEEYSDAFMRLREKTRQERTAEEPENSPAIVFVLTDKQNVSSYTVDAKNRIEDAPLFNIAGMLKGKSKPDEYVIFSGHYDHIGILKPVEGDSIANGADDDASGVTAVISLAKYYKKLNNNERTLIFVAFTAEEMGGLGSRYFSGKLDPDKVVAMFNIEMIGKDSKFGKNSAFITGYELSDFGAILQRNLEGTEFKFYPDPYPDQELFYRSDNATLAALGVPAHTISTDQIDKDKLYHTVDDEFNSLDITNIQATIRAIALSSISIVNGSDTPKRIAKAETGNR